MALLRILRQLCEDNGISLGLQYIPSVLNLWEDKLSHRRDASDWALTQAAVEQVQGQLTEPVATQVFARRETVIPGVRHFHTPTGIGPQDRQDYPCL
jgi:hypothetical protein